MTSFTVGQGFCGACYAEAINRVCATLPQSLAILIRRESREILYTRGPGNAAKHEGHHGH